jgi:1-acyl-sn-glycerol-3-phosphate acyltransferase
MTMNRFQYSAPGERSLRTTLGAWCFGTYAWAVFAVLALAFGILGAFPGSRARARRRARNLARTMFSLTRMPLTGKGLEQLPEGPHVLLVNHASFLDPLALIALLPASPGYTFTARRQFRLQRLLGPLLNSVGTLILERNPHHRENVKMLEAALQRGESLLVFPEGGFDGAPGLKPFHSGVFAAAANCGVPIVVAGVKGARSAVPPGSWLPRRAPLTLEVGAVLDTQELAAKPVTELVTAARRTMARLSGEADAAAFAG